MRFWRLIPQFIDPKGYVGQVFLLGFTAMAVAVSFDGAYAIVTGRASALLTHCVRLVSRIRGLSLIGGGAWLALTRAR